MTEPATSIPNPGQRKANGRFVAGNKGGPGNPHAARVGQLRAALLDAVSEEDLRDIIRKLVDMAKGGDLKAIAMLLDRMAGKPMAEVPSSEPPDTERSRWDFIGRECARLDQLTDAELEAPEGQARVKVIQQEVQALVPYSPPMTPEEEAASRAALDQWLDQPRVG